MIIKQIKNRGASSSAVSSLLDYLVSEPKQIGYQNEYPRQVGRDLILSEAKDREGDKCYFHIVSSVRFDENPTPEIWAFAEQQVKSVLSLENHPHFSATHYETDYHHMHTVIGAVDMESGIRCDPWASYHKLGKARNIIEKNSSLSISNPNNRGLYSRGFGGAKPTWDDEYVRQKINIENKIHELALSSGNWAELQLQLERYHRLVMLHERENQNKLAIYDQVNRWLFDDFENDFSQKYEASLGRFPFERVESVRDYLSAQEHGSLRPRAVNGIDMVNVDIMEAKLLILDNYPSSRIAVSKQSIRNYGDSLSVSLVEHGVGRAGVYSNGIEPYSLEALDQVCANLLARLLEEKTNSDLKLGYSIDNRLIAEFEERNSNIKR